MSELMKALTMLASIKTNLKEAKLTNGQVDFVYSELHDVLGYIVEKRFERDKKCLHTSMKEQTTT